MFERKRRISISILFMLMQNDLCYLGYWEEEEEEVHINIVYAHAEWFMLFRILGRGGRGGPYQYPPNLLSRPNIAFTRLDLYKFCQAILSKVLSGNFIKSFVRQHYQKFCQAILSKYLSGNFIKSFVSSSREKRLFSFPTNYVKCVEIVVQVYFNVKRENFK